MQCRNTVSNKVCQLHKIYAHRSRQLSSVVIQATPPMTNNHKLLQQRFPVTTCNVCIHQHLGSAQYVQRRYISRESYGYYLSSDFPPIGYAQKVLEQIHDISGLPWWASIMLTTVTLRSVITLPLSVYVMHIMARLEKHRPELDKLARELKGEIMQASKMFGWDKKMAQHQFIVNMKRVQKELYIRDNCHPFKTTLVAWAQIPIWVSMSLALRNMAGALPFSGIDGGVQFPELATEGTLWFQNLILPDPTFVLPVILGVVNYTIAEIHSLRPGKKTRIQRYINNTLKGISILMVPIAACVPSSMCWYWTCSSMYGLSQNLIFMLPSVRGTLGLPPVPNQSNTPIRDLVHLAKQKYTRKRTLDVTENDDDSQRKEGKR